jgi:hypothetical protein
MKTLAALILSLFLTAGMAFADTPKDADPKPAKPAASAKPKAATRAAKADSTIAAEVEELRQAIQAEQEQLQLLKEELAKRDRQIDEAREAAAAANARAEEASTRAAEAVHSSAEAKTTAATLNTTVSDLKASNEVLKTTIANNEAQGERAEERPSTIHYKGVDITPGGFIEAATIFRNRATSGDINTPFTGIPFQAAGLAHVPENNFTARQSRLTLLGESKIGAAKLTGYFEMDFLGAGTTSNNRQSNSYVFRQRQIWGQLATDSGWSVTGGQMWTLATENRKGIQNRGEDLPMMVDPQYVVGFTWGRQYAFRVVKDFGGKFAFGVSVEGPQTTIGGRGFSSVTTINAGAAPSTIVTSGATTATTGNFFLDAPGANGGLYNAFDANGYTVNKAPDLIFKAAADPGFGHYEVFGILSFFRNRIYPCGVVGTQASDTNPGTASFTGNCTSPTPTVVSSFGATNNSSTGGGGGASALFSVFNKKVDFGAKAVAGDGIGRYGSSQLADATARPDGTLALIRTAHGLGRVELHPSPKLDIYAYYGAEYAWRAGYSGYDTITVTKTPAIPQAGGGTIPATTTTRISTTGIGGYANVAANNSGCATEGVPINQFNPSSGANCAGDIRIIQEGTLGFWHKFYQGPKGGMRWGFAYSYITKTAWSGAGSVTPKANDNMFWTSFRYYLP